MKWIAAIICIPVAAYCIFGFLATFEPGVSNAIAFRSGFVIIGFACLVGIAYRFVPRKAS